MPLPPRRSSMPNRTPAPIYTQQPAEQRSKSRWPLIVLIVLLIAALGVGAGWTITHYLNGSDTPNNTDVSDDPTISDISDDTTIVPDIPKVIRIPADAYPGAGEAKIPSDAWLTGESDGSFDWMAPSENIRCWSNGYSDEMRCMIASWQDDAPEGYSSSGRPADTVILGIDGTPTLAADGSPIGHVDSTLLYDTTIYDANRNWVCGAKSNGITCWSLRSGHGFLINRAGLQAF